MKENVSGCFFLNTVYVKLYVPIEQSSALSSHIRLCVVLILNTDFCSCIIICV